MTNYFDRDVMIRHYAYRPRWTTILFCAGFFGACAIVLANAARNRDLNSAIFYWLLAAVSAAFVAIAGFLIIIRFLVAQRISVSEIGLLVPRSRWSSDTITIPFADVTRLSTLDASGERFLRIEYSNYRFDIAASLLPRNQDFDEICAAIAAGVQSAAKN